MTTAIPTDKRPAYPAYKPSGVPWLGDVPEHWEVHRLKYAASINDEALPETTNPDYEFTYVDIGNVDAAKGIVATETYRFKDAPSRARRIVRDGDTIVSTVRTYLRAIAPIQGADGSLIVSTGFAVVRPRKLGPGYLSYALRAPFFVETVVSRSTGVSYPAINAPEVGNIGVTLPPLDEQRAIAAFLDRETPRIDALIEKKRRQIELLQEKRSALISHAVTKGLNPHAPMKGSGIEWLGQIPAHWQVKRLKRLGKAQIGLTYNPADLVDENEGTLVLRASNVCDGKIVLGDNVFVKADIPQRMFTRIGDILICSRSGSRALIGKCAIVDSASAGMSFGAFMTVFRSSFNDYLFYVFNSSLFDYQSGACLTSTINQLTLENLYGLEVPIPPLDEQRAISSYLDHESARIDVLVEKIQYSIRKLQGFRIAVISAAVTGKIDVRQVNP